MRQEILPHTINLIMQVIFFNTSGNTWGPLEGVASVELLYFVNFMRLKLYSYFGDS